jgi:hypothetical protein
MTGQILATTRSQANLSPLTAYDGSWNSYRFIKHLVKAGQNGEIEASPDLTEIDYLQNVISQFGDSVYGKKNYLKNRFIEVLATEDTHVSRALLSHRVLAKSLKRLSPVFLNLLILHAARHNHVEAVQKILETKLITKEERGWAVVFAAENGHLETVRVLLAAGPIAERLRQEAVLKAFGNGFFDILKELKRYHSVVVRTQMH